MDRRRRQFALIGIGIVLTMGFVLAVGLRSGSGFAYYLTVSEFQQHGATRGDQFRVNGKVENGTIERHNSGQDVFFVMTDGAAKLAVRYHGIIPDTFVDGADVVVEGKTSPDGTFEARTLLAKCPSKYEAADAPATAKPDSI